MVRICYNLAAIAYMQCRAAYYEALVDKVPFCTYRAGYFNQRPR